MLTNRQILSLIVNLGLVCSGLVMAFSGLLIQINYHIGNHGNTKAAATAFGIHYHGWSDIHRISIAIFSIFAFFHIVLHWKWYKTVVKNNLIAKNIQLITLSTVFILTSITGYIPWVINIIEREETTRRTFIEIHDKLAIVLLIYLILHIIKRLKWFFISFNKLINKHSTQQRV